MVEAGGSHAGRPLPAFLSGRMQQCFVSMPGNTCDKTEEEKKGEKDEYQSSWKSTHQEELSGGAVSRFSERQLQGSIPFLASFASKRASGSYRKLSLLGESCRAPGVADAAPCGGTCAESWLFKPPNESTRAKMEVQFIDDEMLTQIVVALTVSADLLRPLTAGVIMGVPICFISSFTGMLLQLIQQPIIAACSGQTLIIHVYHPYRQFCWGNAGNIPFCPLYVCRFL